jgi:hypothetical protein
MATQTNRSMISETSICNQALSWLGAEQIESLEDPSAAAEYCRNNYPFIRDAVLEERMWSFALARYTSVTADRPEWGDNLYSHEVPLDWLQVFRVYDSVSADEQAEWSREGLNIISPCSTLYMWGVKRITDTGKFSTMFVQCVAARMAAELAAPLAQDRTLQADMWTLYGEKLAAAAARDGQQGRNEVVSQSKLTGARHRPTFWGD